MPLRAATKCSKLDTGISSSVPPATTLTGMFTKPSDFLVIIKKTNTIVTHENPGDANQQRAALRV